jgi:hypothetical protein
MQRANRTSVLAEQRVYGHRGDTLVKAIEVPVAVSYGANDFIALSSSETWMRAFPNARTLVIERSSQSPFAGRTDDFFSSIEMFLSGG